MTTRGSLRLPLRLPLWAAALSLLGCFAATGCDQQGISMTGMDTDMGTGSAPDLLAPAPLTPGDGHVADAVIGTLNSLASAKRGRTWNVSTQNLLEGAWLIQSPPEPTWGRPYSALTIPAACSGAGCNPDFGLRICSTQADCTGGGTCTPVAASITMPGGTPTKMCIGHSDHVYEEMYRVLISAQRYADVTSLLPPDGRFLAAMRNAVTYLARTGLPVQARFLFGNYPATGGSVDTKAVLTSLTRDIPAGSQLKVAVGSYRSCNLPPSWNHSKIVAADGRAVIVGGHNLWDAHYLGKNPVHDVSMRLRGPAAVDAHLFANEQWSYTCSTMNFTCCFVTGSVCSHQYAGGSIANQCPQSVPAAMLTPDLPGDVRAVAMGRLALIDSTNMSNQSDTAFLSMMGAAKKSIRMAQQDLGPLKIGGVATGSWPNGVFAQLGAAMVRGVDVYIVLSNKDSVAGGLSGSEASYSNGWTLEEVGTHIRDYIEQNPPAGAPTGAALRQLICQKLHLAPLRFSGEDTFPDGVPLPLHAKFVMIDDQGFYIGSQNQYDAGLTEYGYLVDDARAGDTVLRSFWTPLWQSSSRRAISGTEAATCSLK
jgi:phosphatidylserine/phosphatidylglycerophosphate/cardiolipin synthase-like enzyme